MKPEELLELQSALVTCLTDPGALSEFRAGAAAWEKLSFLDPELMELMSSLCHGKRLDKLNKILPMTLAHLAPEMGELAHEFMRRHPPRNSDSYTNACQFYGFLRRRWRHHPPDPPFLPDLAYCELARISLERQTVSGVPAVLQSLATPAQPSILIRRRNGIRLHRCQYDVQPLFEHEGHDGAAIAPIPVCVVLSQPLASSSGKMFCVDPQLFGMLQGLRGWTAVSLASEQTVTFLRHLEELGFLEVQICGSQ